MHQNRYEIIDRPYWNHVIWTTKAQNTMSILGVKRGDIMVRVNEQYKIGWYHSIYEVMWKTPYISISEIAGETGFTRNTASKYVRDMFTNHIISDPSLCLKPAPNYTEYVYLMDFKDPWGVFMKFPGFPHVLYHAITEGHWNTLVITDKLLDFSQLVDFQAMTAEGKRGAFYTPFVTQTTWEESFKKAHNMIKSTPVQVNTREEAPFLPWGEREWKLYYAFKDNIRRKAASILKKINVRYDYYVEWVKSLHNHCTVTFGFYPEGYSRYMKYCFFLSSDYEELVKSVFTLFPTTPVIMEVDNNLLILASLQLSDTVRDFFSLIREMRINGLINEFMHAPVLSQYWHR